MSTDALQARIRRRRRRRWDTPEWMIELQMIAVTALAMVAASPIEDGIVRLAALVAALGVLWAVARRVWKGTRRAWRALDSVHEEVVGMRDWRERAEVRLDSVERKIDDLHGDRPQLLRRQQPRQQEG